MSIALPAPAARAGSASATRVVDGLLFAAVLTITFAKLRWPAGGADVNISDVTAGLFVVAFAFSRVERHDGRLPRSATVLLVFFGLFLVVYLAGFFNLETIDDRDPLSRGS